ncbi:MAG: helix-turn-helix transcriptional regulator [Anaerolineae bacterium]
MEVIPVPEIQDTLIYWDQPNPIVMGLLHQILAYTNSGSLPADAPTEQPPTAEVVLELQVDGMRYTLTRSLPPAPESQVNLSPREQEIARLVAKGLPNKTIAAVLDISQWTVSTHLRRVFTKLGVSTRAEMVAHLSKEGLLTSEESKRVDR